MPEYRTGQVRGGQQFAGVSRYLNLKRVFEDAKRQQQWAEQNEATQQRGQRTQQATQLMDYGLPGADINNFVETGQFPKDFQGKRQNTPYSRWSPEERLDYREQVKEQDLLFLNKKNLDTYLSDANQVKVALNKIESMSKNLGDFNRGLIGQTLGKAKVGYGKYVKDEKITKYLGVVAQELIPLARKVMEEKGPITEWDVDRVERGLGDPTAPLSDKLFLINEMRKKVNEAIKLKRSLAGFENTDVEQSNVFTPDDEKRLQELERKLGK